MKIVHYINQFFGQIGGEDMAYHPLEVRKGPFGPGIALQNMLGKEIQITSTILCGDNYFVENTENLKDTIIKVLRDEEADLLVTGPAFNAGRYGIACGEVCKIAYEELGLTAVSGMYPENPGAELFRKFAYIFPVGKSARNMKEALFLLSDFIKKINSGQEIKGPKEEGYIQRGIRKNYFAKKTGAERCLDMLLKKIKKIPYQTELPMPIFEKVQPSPAISNMQNAKIIVMTSGGMVPQGNPDHLEACNCTKYKRYYYEESYGGKGTTKGKVVHGGYDPVYGDEDGNRILPVDMLVELEKEGRIGELCDFTYVTVGNGMGTDQAAAFGDAIAEELKREKIQGAILTST